MVVQNLEKKIAFKKKCHEAHQIEQRNVLHRKMWWGSKITFFFQGSKVVRIGQSWPAEFHDRHFVSPPLCTCLPLWKSLLRFPS